ncbi:MAG: hypothetical protein WC900_10075 [Oscillospiraceae bacterium]
MVFRRVSDYISMNIRDYLFCIEDKEKAAADLVWEMENQSSKLLLSAGQSELKLEKIEAELSKSKKRCLELDEKLHFALGIEDLKTARALQQQKYDEEEKIHDNELKRISYSVKLSQANEQLSALKKKIQEASAFQNRFKSERKKIEGKPPSDSEALKNIHEKALEDSSTLEWVKNKATIDAEFDRLMGEIKSKLL